VQIISKIALRLVVVHASGIAHCNINMNTVVWKPSEQWSWDLSGWSLAGTIGEMGPLPPASYYTDPQMAARRQMGYEADIISPASDMWALGVLFFTLLRKKPPFDGITDHDEV
jgi:serine/threonine protein kinase